MLKLSAKSPLGSLAPYVFETQGFRVEECLNVALVSVTRRKDTGDVGLAMPAVARVGREGDLTVFWTAPDQCFVEADEAQYPDLAGELASRLTGASITEQTGAWVKLGLAGGDVIAVLQKLVMLDVDRFEDGQVSRTLVEHLGIYVLKQQGRFFLYAPSSTARHLTHALETAAQAETARQALAG